MRKIIQISVDAEGYSHALCDDGSVWYQRNKVVNGTQLATRERFHDIPQDDAQEQESDVIDAGMKEHKEGCEAYCLPISKILKDIESDQKNLSEDSDEYKDLQLLLELVDLAWGATALCGIGHEARLKNLVDSRKILNNKKVMV